MEELVHTIREFIYMVNYNTEILTSLNCFLRCRGTVYPFTNQLIEERIQLIKELTIILNDSEKPDTLHRFLICKTAIDIYPAMSRQLLKERVQLIRELRALIPDTQTIYNISKILTFLDTMIQEANITTSPLSTQ